MTGMVENQTQGAAGCLGRALIWFGSTWLILAGLAGIGVLREFGPLQALGLFGGSLVPALIFILAGTSLRRVARRSKDEVVLGGPISPSPQARPPLPTTPTVEEKPVPGVARSSPVVYRPLPEVDEGDEDRFSRALANEMDDPLQPEPGVEPDFDPILEPDNPPLTSEEMIAEARRRLTGESGGA